MILCRLFGHRLQRVRVPTTGPNGRNSMRWFCERCSYTHELEFPEPPLRPKPPDVTLAQALSGPPVYLSASSGIGELRFPLNDLAKHNSLSIPCEPEFGKRVVRVLSALVEPDPRTINERIRDDMLAFIESQEKP